MPERLQYIDALRAFAIFLVVVGHIYLFGFGYYGKDYGSSYCQYIYQLHMPLFFFISGFVLCKENKVWGLQDLKKVAVGKFLPLVVTPLIFMTVVSYAYGHNILDSLSDPSKYGYWFTFTLYAFLLLNVAILTLVSRFGFNKLGGGNFDHVRFGNVCCHQRSCSITSGLRRANHGLSRIKPLTLFPLLCHGLCSQIL